MVNTFRFQTDQFPWWEMDLNLNEPEEIRAGKELAEFLCERLSSWDFDATELENDEYGWTLIQKKRISGLTILSGPYHQIDVTIVSCDDRKKEGCWNVTVSRSGRTLNIGRVGIWRRYEPNEQLLGDIEAALKSIGIQDIENLES